MEQALINRIVEAALLASSQPLSVQQLAELFTVDAPPPPGSLRRALLELQAECAGRGVELVEVASGWRYQVHTDVHPWVARLWTERQTKYTRATLETLALIAYRQPITRGEIEQIRGVATNSNIIKALEERDWIRSVGHRDVPGRPELLGTTKAFLDYFGLKKLEDLPPLSELKDFGELEPQLDLDAAPIPAQAAGETADAANAPAQDDAATGDAGDAADASSPDDTATAGETDADAAPSDETRHDNLPDTDAAGETGDTPSPTQEETGIAADGEARSTP